MAFPCLSTKQVSRATCASYFVALATVAYHSCIFSAIDNDDLEHSANDARTTPML